jgi:hypothetical protein
MHLRMHCGLNRPRAVLCVVPDEDRRRDGGRLSADLRAGKSGQVTTAW